jgi:hypothetical protein
VGRSLGARIRIAALGATVALLALVPSAMATIATKPLSTWQVNGRVNAIMQIGSVTYVGGKFTAATSHNGATDTVSDLAAFDASGNFVSTWTPMANGTVKTFATDGSGNIIAGGSFTKINGAGHQHLVVIQPDGTVVSKAAWAGVADGDVQALAVSGSTLYMGGLFQNVDGQPRPYLGAVSLTNGQILSWNPFVDGRVDDLAVVTGGSVVAGGFFLNAGSASGGHPSLAEFDGSTGALIANYVGHTSSPVVSMTQGGDGSLYTGHNNNLLQRFTPTGGQSWQLSVDGNVQALTISDGELIAGGHFNNLCTLHTNCQSPISRHHIAAFDPTTGSLDTSWAPDVNSDLGVFALADTSTGLALGGDFTKVGGVAQAHLAFLKTGASVPVDSTPPTISPAPNPILRSGTSIASGMVPLLVRWGASDPSGVCSTQLQREVGGGPWGSLSLSSRTATSRAITLRPSTTVRTYKVRATDCVGNTSQWSTSLPLTLTSFQDGSAHIAYTRAWKRASASKAYGGTIHVASKAGAYATLHFTGREVAWVATRAANRGTARVYLDGTLAATLNLHSGAAMHKRIVFAHVWAANAAHTIKIVCAGTAGHPAVDVDALLTVR